MKTSRLRWTIERLMIAAIIVLCASEFALWNSYVTLKAQVKTIQAENVKLKTAPKK